MIQPSEKLEISRMETDLDVIQSVYERGNDGCQSPYEGTERMDGRSKKVRELFSEDLKF